MYSPVPPTIIGCFGPYAAHRYCQAWTSWGGSSITRGSRRVWDMGVYSWAWSRSKFSRSWAACLSIKWEELPLLPSTLRLNAEDAGAAAAEETLPALPLELPPQAAPVRAPPGRRALRNTPRRTPSARRGILPLSWRGGRSRPPHWASPPARSSHRTRSRWTRPRSCPRRRTGVWWERCWRGDLPQNLLRLGRRDEVRKFLHGRGRASPIT